MSIIPGRKHPDGPSSRPKESVLGRDPLENVRVGQKPKHLRVIDRPIVRTARPIRHKAS